MRNQKSESEKVIVK